jgi:hypothetical protein
MVYSKYKVTSINPEIHCQGETKWQIGRASDGSQIEGEIFQYGFQFEPGTLAVGDIISADWNLRNPEVIEDVFLEQKARPPVPQTAAAHNAQATGSCTFTADDSTRAPQSTSITVADLNARLTALEAILKSHLAVCPGSFTGSGSRLRS